MNKTAYIKNLIQEKYPSLKDFSRKSDLPYTTLHSMLSRGIGNASTDNVIKLCRALNISFDSLNSFDMAHTLNIGQRIKERRLELGYSVDDLAKLIGKNRATVYRYENNDIENHSIFMLELLARVLKTTPVYLMGCLDNDRDNLLDTKYVTDAKGVYSFSEQEIYDLAVHGVGHHESLTDDEREDVKLAIRIALEKHKKDR